VFLRFLLGFVGIHVHGKEYFMMQRDKKTAKGQRKTDTPAYALLLVKHGLLSPRVSSVDAFGLWMRLCEDPVVRERSKKKAAGKRPAYLASFASGYKYAEFVLKQMSIKDLEALKNRLGVRG
jgi:hypothetical protein